MTTRRLLISGRVQGVGYRDWLAGEADRLGVSGWVRNVADGRVEAVVQGEDAAVEVLLLACQNGPVFARVAEVEASVAERLATVGFSVLASV